MRGPQAYLTFLCRWPHGHDGSATLLTATALEEANHCHPLPYFSDASSWKTSQAKGGSVSHLDPPSSPESQERLGRANILIDPEDVGWIVGALNGGKPVIMWTIRRSHAIFPF